MFGNVCLAFEQSLKVFGNLQKSRHQCIYVINNIIHGCLQIQNLSSRVQPYMSLVRSLTHGIPIKLNTRRGIPYLRTPKYYPLELHHLQLYLQYFFIICRLVDSLQNPSLAKSWQSVTLSRHILPAKKSSYIA